MGKIEKEKRVISLIISIYCKKKHACTELCDECKSLEQYAHLRLNNCRYGENKGFCSNCPTQCYAQQQKACVREVMRFSSGPYMFFHHPFLLIKHILGAPKKA